MLKANQTLPPRAGRVNLPKTIIALAREVSGVNGGAILDCGPALPYRSPFPCLNIGKCGNTLRGKTPRK